MHAYSLSGREAGSLATRVRLLRRQRLLTAHQAALADVMLWSARRPGSGLLTASLAVLARLAGQARSTATEGIRRLEELGIIQRIRRRVRVAWGGSVASRVIANGYRMVAVGHVPAAGKFTGTDARSARNQPLRISILEPQIAAVKAAQEALNKRREAVLRTMLAQRGVALT